MNGEAILTVSAAVVALTQLAKWSGTNDKLGPLVVLVLAAFGVAFWGYSTGTFERTRAFEYFAGWIAIATSAAGVFGFTRAGTAAVTAAVTAATAPPASGAGSHPTEKPTEHHDAQGARARRRVKSLIVAILAIGLVAGCAKTPPNISPEGRVAYHGERFMAAVERAQQDTIALVTAGTITKAQAAPAVETFVRIGLGGQRLAAALAVIDSSQVTESKVEAAQRVRQVVTEFQHALTGLTVRVDTESARERITRIVTSLGLSMTLLDIVQAVSRVLPVPMSPVVPGGSAHAR